METTALYYHFDDEGYFTETSEVFEGVDAPENATLEVWSEPCYKPRFVDGEWVDDEPQPMDDDFLKLLKEQEELERLLNGGGSGE